MRHPAPHIRFQESTRTLMSDVILLLLVLCAPAYLFYGPRPLVICGVSVATAVIADIICTLVRGKRINIFDYSPIVTGLIIALTMPATISYRVIIAAVLFSIIVVKHPFGGVGNNLFNPAAAGFSFAAICWPEQVFMYPQPFEAIPAFGEVSVKLFQNPAFVLKLGGIPTNDISEMIFGKYPGPMGATNILVILACLGYLLFRRTISWHLSVSFLASCASVAFLFPRVGTNGVQSVLFEMMSGILLFGAVFVVTDPATSPKRASSLAVYGIFAGVVTMLFRYLGGFEESMPFAVLFSNAFVPVIDRYNESLHRVIRRKNLEIRKAKKLQKV
ncbi:RnfABCDGE type electron transport complex subunit D [Oscillospiraceae bacterium PP1C4]